jgi:DNA-binding MarR family transcriptional regulator
MAKRQTTYHRQAREQEANQLHPGRHLIGELLHAHQALMNLFSREVGIAPARLKLLHELLHAGQDGIGLNDLALRLSVTPPLITRQVKELESEGWVQRRSDTRDGRRSVVHLSPTGDVEVMKLHVRAHRFETALIEDMNQGDIAVAIRVLLNLCERLESWRRMGKSPLKTDQTDNTGYPLNER